ncbi:MAG: hypothetical protein VZR22_01635 [Candidatus Cryptobacteroides sp.]|nr:hypothetical protein [Candidatus Cryptobacteroides sp.]
MKTSYSIHIIPAVLLVLSACTNDSLSPENGSEPAHLRATFDADVAVTKSILIDNPGVKLESFWEAGEQIGVFGGNVGNALFTLMAEDLSYDRKTADFTTDGTIPAGKLTAYSPYQKGATGDGDAIVVNFPATQHYTTYNGVVQPDPVANILLGEGSKGSGLNFRNMTAVLKIGQAFEAETLVKTVEFRDLSGASVSGTMKLTGGAAPKAEITGSGTVLTLDLGEGIEFQSGSVSPLFLMVPAREYKKGFEITFIDSNGAKTVRTVGATMGKTLERGVVYLIGDISGENYEAETTSTLKSGAILMTPEALDKILLLDRMTMQLTDENGNPCYDQNGVPIYRPRLNLLVHKDLSPKVGGWLVFNQASDDLPYGGVYKITDCTPQGDYFDVLASPEVNFAAAYEELQIGEPLYDESGNLQEEGGVELDLASHIVSIVDEEGNTIPFNATKGGVIQFSEDAAASLLGLPETKIAHKTYSFPGLSLKHSGDNAECSLGAQLSLKTKLAVRSMQGEMQYVHFTMDPEFKFNAEFVLKGEVSYGMQVHLIKLIISPIIIGPVVITPTIDISGEIGLGGEVKFSTSLSYTYNAGMYGLSYNRGDGFTARHESPKPQPLDLTPEIGGASASLGAYASLHVDPYLSIYGLFGLGAKAEFKLKFGATVEDKTQSVKLALEPELEIIPSIASLGGYFTHTFNDLTTNVSFDPLWERYLSPKVILASSGYQSLPLSSKFYDFEFEGKKLVSAQVPVSPETWFYNIKLEEPTAVKYEVQVRVVESDGKIDRRDQFTFEPRPAELVTGEYYDDFELCFNAGNPYLYWGEWGASSDYGSGSRVVASKTVGVYPSSDAADFEGDVFEGSFKADVTSHHEFWTEVYLIPVGSGAERLLSRSKSKVYFWPNDVQGRKYKESE